MKIGIIGAGLAGLKVGSELKKQGHDITVFEKSRGKGGRLANKRLDWGVFDIGAQYFTARSEVFKQEVKSWEKLGLVTPWRLCSPKRLKGVN